MMHVTCDMLGACVSTYQAHQLGEVEGNGDLHWLRDI